MVGGYEYSIRSIHSQVKNSREQMKHGMDEKDLPFIIATRVMVNRSQVIGNG
jgi:hypothetical protein